MSVVDQFYACHSCMNRRVRVQMFNGAFHEGVVVNVDRNNLYLQVAPGHNINKCTISAWGFWGSNAILTLALFDLLAIALLV